MIVDAPLEGAMQGENRVQIAFDLTILLNFDMYE